MPGFSLSPSNHFLMSLLCFAFLIEMNVILVGIQRRCCTETKRMVVVKPYSQGISLNNAAF